LSTGGSGLGMSAGTAGLNTAGMASTIPVGSTLSTMPGTMMASGAGKGLVGGIMSSPYTAPALISGGTQLIGGAMQGYGAKKQQDQQVQMAEDERKRYNTNVGTRLWG
jgi:hypothetical protein